MILVKKVYGISLQLPSSEKFGLRSQITRSAVSIPSNIAEGCSRKTDSDFLDSWKLLSVLTLNWKHKLS